MLSQKGNRQLEVTFQGESQGNKYTDLILFSSCISCLCFLPLVKLRSLKALTPLMYSLPWDPRTESRLSVALEEQKEDNQHRGAIVKVVIIPSESILKFTMLIYILVKVLDFGT